MTATRTRGTNQATATTLRRSPAGTAAGALHLLLGLPLGTLYLTAIITGLSLAVGLMPLALLGIPTLIGLWYLVRTFLHLEVRLADALLDVRIEPIPPVPSPDGGLWRRFTACLSDRYGWRGMLHLLLRFPVGIITFTAVVTLVSLTLGLTFAPTYLWAGDNADWMGPFDSYGWSFALVPIGIGLGFVTVRIIDLLADASGRWVASALDSRTQ